MKKLLIIIGVILAVVIVLYFVAGYFLGNLPVASNLLGTNKPKDLGIELTASSALKGIHSLNKPLTVADLESIYNNPESYTKVNASIGEEEASSLLALADLPDFPLRLVQLNFGDNGTVKASGVMDISKLQAALQDYGASGDVVDRIMGIAKTAHYMNFYAEGKCSIKNNNLNVELDKLQLGRIDLPTDFVRDNAESITGYVERSLTDAGYNIRSMTISEGKITFDMDRPVSSISPWLKFVESAGTQ
jgi:hypothetical protein